MERGGSGSEQVDLAEDRTVLAAERTYSAWLRTGLAFLVAGLAAQRFLREALPAWELRVVALVMILGAVASFAAAGWRHLRARRRLPEAGIGLLPSPAAVGLVGLLIAAALLGAVALWLT